MSNYKTFTNVFKATNIEQEKLDKMICKFLDLQGIRIDALGNLRAQPGNFTNTNPEMLAKIAHHQFLHKGCKHGLETIRVRLEVVIEIVSVERRRQIYNSIIRHPADPAGLDELKKFISAITGTSNELTVQIFLHWIWLVKRSMAGLQREHELMIILFSKLQGNGKSTGIRKFCEPHRELAVGIDASTITDDRRCPELFNHTIGDWDEMEGASKSDTATLKNVITSNDVTYRPMRTNAMIRKQRLMCFIGSSNKPVKEIIKDVTGSRRFFQVNCQDKIDWDSINNINYELIWRGISEVDDCPIKPHWNEVQTLQEEQVAVDSVAWWLEDEKWGPLLGVDNCKIEDVIISGSQTLATRRSTRERYARWCFSVEERAVSVSHFNARLVELGFKQTRPDLKGNGRPHCWIIPDSVSSKAASTEAASTEAA